MGRCNLLILLALATVCTFSCSREEASDDISLFYGKWKASYGDTVTFARQNGRNVLIYDVSGSPGGPIAGVTDDHEFDYQNGKLRIKEGIGLIGDYRTVTSFSWTQKGLQFTTEKREWLYYISSVGHFTFTKIQ